MFKRNLRFIIVGLVVALTTVMCVIFWPDRTEREDKGKSELDNVGNSANVIEEKGFEISTPYGPLYYPEKWKEFVRIEETEATEYKLQFWALIDGHEEQHLFDIVYEGKGENFLGYIHDKNGDKVSVHMECFDINISEEWSKEQKEQLFAMQEDVNYIIDRLQENEKFEN